MCWNPSRVLGVCGCLRSTLKAKRPAMVVIICMATLLLCKAVEGYSELNDVLLGGEALRLLPRDACCFL
jgi:hypothetical protein